MKTAATAAIYALAIWSQAGEFTLVKTDTDKKVKIYTYTGEIVKSDVDAYKELLKQTDHIVVGIESPGGNFLTGIELGRETMKSQGKVTLVVVHAYSAAGLWAMGDKGAQFLNDESEIGLHLPYMPKDPLTDGQAMFLGFKMGEYLNEVLPSEEIATNMMADLAEIRDSHPKTAMRVWGKAGKLSIKD